MSKPRPRFVDLNLGPLPVAAINRTLDLELEPGDVVFTASAQAHAYRRHPNDYPKCLPHVGPVVQQPHYIGDDLKNAGKIELIARVPALGGGLLVALLVETDADGRYLVVSCYPIGSKKIDNRRQSGHLTIPKWK